MYGIAAIQSICGSETLLPTTWIQLAKAVTGMAARRIAGVVTR
jgi:hypothetical protein